jgi:uncharacterized membrane protein YcgQ (UPF0703/DUF1980 family)
MCRKQFTGNRLIIAIAMMAIIVSLCTVSCTNAKKTSDKALVITEKMFVGQVNDVYLNTKVYLGRTIKLEGIFKSEQYSGRLDPFFYVVRYGPGCCGTDSNAGFEVKWDGNRMKQYPTAESWVEATGVLKIGQDGSAQYLYLDLISLDVLSKRGAEYVIH